MPDVRQKLVVFFGDDGEMKAGWITVPVLEAMLKDGTLVETPMNDNQAAVVIDAASRVIYP